MFIRKNLINPIKLQKCKKYKNYIEIFIYVLDIFNSISFDTIFALKCLVDKIGRIFCSSNENGGK